MLFNMLMYEEHELEEPEWYGMYVCMRDGWALQSGTLVIINIRSFSKRFRKMLGSLSGCGASVSKQRHQSHHVCVLVALMQ